MRAGDNHHGDVVNMHGGHHNQGIVHHHAPRPTPEETLRAVVELARALRGEVPEEDRASIDDALPVLAAGPSAGPTARRRSLMALAAVAATVGAIGQPLLDSVRAALELIAR
ncbi:hypothetical protein GCM10010275_11360 [Streptomyces litmocidini]|uniref:hypothetical protein n=1 Tax=Streptomyces litmocidini TaxID=67318 RepID=UPI0019CCD710|nr:hypothetical protein [Streptomyces litmocidini]GGU78351.1 hypothetical protein GCM10010275_11360 [Streptomyces litmocidini]